MNDFKTHKITSPIGLMLDNLVYNRHGEISGIRINDLHAFDHPDMGGNYGLYGIPLTEEWLIRMGFEYDQITYSKEFVWLGTGETGYDVWLSGLHHGMHTHVSYVHQLQNLWFSLMGDELAIK